MFNSVGSAGGKAQGGKTTLKVFFAGDETHKKKIEKRRERTGLWMSWIFLVISDAENKTISTLNI